MTPTHLPQRQEKVHSSYKFVNAVHPGPSGNRALRDPANRLHAHSSHRFSSTHRADTANTPIANRNANTSAKVRNDAATSSHSSA